MQHSSYELTESVTPVHNSNVAHQSQICIVPRPRVKLHPVKATPVTHSVRTKPFRVRLQPQVKQHDLIRRKLFPTITPRKKRPHERVSIRVNCGRERTQPLTTKAGSLTSFLRNCIIQAEQRIHAFRTAVQTKQFTKRILENNLIVRIIQRDRDLVFVEQLNSVDKKTTRLAVLVSGDVLSVPGIETEAMERYMFIPHPWQAHNLRIVGHRNIDILIVPYRVSVATRSEIQSALQSQPLSQTLNESVRLAASQCNHHSDAHEGDTGEGSTRLHTLEIFHKLSPHTTVVNLDVYVDFCFPHKGFAIIRDNVGELAILTAVNERKVEFRKGEKHCFPNVHVLPQRITSNAVLQIATLESSESHNQLVQSPQKTLFAFSICKPE